MVSIQILNEKHFSYDFILFLNTFLTLIIIVFSFIGCFNHFSTKTKNPEPPMAQLYIQTAIVAKTFNLWWNFRYKKYVSECFWWRCWNHTMTANILKQKYYPDRIIILFHWIQSYFNFIFQAILESWLTLHSEYLQWQNVNTFLNMFVNNSLPWVRKLN